MRHSLTAAAAVLLAAPASHAQNIPETKLTASDGSDGDRFGTSVAISGDTVIVGAPRGDDNRTDSGSAYLFDLVTGDETKLTASDGATVDRYGASVGTSNTTAIVGARGDDDNGSLSGSAYQYDTTNGAKTKLTASDGAAGDRFGGSAAISGSTAIVGVPRDDDNGNRSGSAYLFDTATGAETKLTASDAASFDDFGNAVAISGTTAIIGADGDDDSGSPTSSTPPRAPRQS